MLYALASIRPVVAPKPADISRSVAKKAVTIELTTEQEVIELQKHTNTDAIYANVSNAPSRVLTLSELALEVMAIETDNSRINAEFAVVFPIHCLYFPVGLSNCFSF